MQYIARHGFGYSIFEYAEDGIVAEVLDFQRGDARDDIAVVVIRVP